MSLPVLADTSWLRKFCAESRNQRGSLEPNSATPREGRKMREGRKEGGRGKRKNNRNHPCISHSGRWDVFMFEGIM